MIRAVVLVGVTFWLAACGGESAKAPTILDTEKVERAIETSALEQQGKRARVSCPSGVHQKKDLEFKCTAVVGRTETTFAVTQTDASGQVHYVAR